MSLFNRVFSGSDEMYAKAREELDAVIARVGRDAPITMPDTAYYLACSYAYAGKKVTTVGEMDEALEHIHGMMTREQKLNDVFNTGIATAMAAEIMPICPSLRPISP